jgi:hypothetical protein
MTHRSCEVTIPSAMGCAAFNRYVAVQLACLLKSCGSLVAHYRAMVGCEDDHAAATPGASAVKTAEPSTFGHHYSRRGLCSISRLFGMSFSSNRKCGRHDVTQQYHSHLHGLRQIYYPWQVCRLQDLKQQAVE